ncbi:MAG: AMP-binding protein [Acidimicrobiia bacterium]|nr:AMP-binding protein [Acidimicrobiia bacterium]
MSDAPASDGMFEQDPERPALIDAATGTTRTYGDLTDRAGRLAAALDSKGLDPVADTGSRAVAVMLPNCIEFLEVAAAASRAEASFLPVNWHLKRDELAWILADSGARVVVAHPSLREHVDAAVADTPGTAVLWAGSEYEDAIAGHEPADRPGWSTPSFLFYTSGTTGRPKGVVHSGLDPNRMHAAQLGLAHLWGFGPTDVHLLAGPAYHAGPLGYALNTLFTGGATAVLPAWDPKGALAAIDRHRVTTSFLTPAHFVRLLELPEAERARHDLSSLRLVIHAGAPCPVVVKERILDWLGPLGCEVWELYGASEGGATRASPDEWRARPGTVGRPWPGTEIRILDAEGAAVAAGGDGVIHIAPPGGGATFHYHRDEAKTDAAWRDGAFTVGDVGHLDDDGYLFITDRVSDMVLVDGVNVYPREIEEVLFAHPAVVDCAVVGVPDERHGEQLVAVVERRGDGLPVDALAAFAREHLADYKVPRRWELVGELPRDPNGKVLKRLLKERLSG